MTGSDTTFPYEKTEKDFLIVASIIVAETRLLLLGNFETKARNLGMRLVLTRLLPSYATIQEVYILNVLSLIYGKTEKDFLIVACVKAAETRLLSQGKIKTLGLIFRHETKGLLPSYTTIQEVFRSLTIVF